MSEEYDNTHRAFLQSFLAHSTLTLDAARPLLAAIQTAQAAGRGRGAADISEGEFGAYVATVNTALSPFDLEIRSGREQRGGARVWALVNCADDALSKVATAYAAPELAFVRRVLDAMFEANNTPRAEVCAVSAMHAVRRCKPEARRESGGPAPGAAAAGITMARAEEVLREMVEQGWFEKSGRGYYSLSARALMELRGWLVETYNEAYEEEEAVVRIKVCHACKEIVTVGQRCPNRQCLCRLHDICTANFFQMQRSRTCPLCKAEWTGQDYVGEKAALKEKGTRRSGASARRQSRGMDGADDEEDGDEDEG